MPNRGRPGGVLVPLNSFLKGDCLRHQLHDAQAAVVVGDAAGIAATLAVGADLSPPPPASDAGHNLSLQRRAADTFRFQLDWIARTAGV